MWVRKIVCKNYRSRTSTQQPILAESYYIDQACYTIIPLHNSSRNNCHGRIRISPDKRGSRSLHTIIDLPGWCSSLNAHKPFMSEVFTRLDPLISIQASASFSTKSTSWPLFVRQ